MSDLPAIVPTKTTQPYWDGLRAGKLLYQYCRACGNRWLPGRDACPRCLSPDAGWEESGGTGRVLSWVVFHIAYHDAFKEKIPYDVTLVELDEGPRLLTNIIDSDAGKALAPGRRVRVEIQADGGLHLPRFRLVADR